MHRLLFFIFEDFFKKQMKNIAITENHLYKKVYDYGLKQPCKHIVVYALIDYHANRLKRENPLKKKVNRLGLTVTKRIGGAVVRSRVRRILRHAYQAVDKNYEIKKGLLIVIVAKQEAINAKSTEIEKDLVYAFKKLGVITSKT